MRCGLNSIKREVAAICSMFEMKENRDYRLKSSFYMFGSMDSKDNYWVHELQVKYLQELNKMLMDLGFEINESENEDVRLENIQGSLDNPKVIDLYEHKAGTKIHYKLIEGISECPPPDKEQWL